MVHFWDSIFPFFQYRLLANLTARAIIGAFSLQNLNAVPCSLIGHYTAELPAPRAVLSTYCFVIWVVLFLFTCSQHGVSFLQYLSILVMYTKAMHKEEILKEKEGDSMTANRLFKELLNKVMEEKKKLQCPSITEKRSKLKKKLQVDG
ncbi:hypothetical protein ACHAWX_000227 [Stephanocyclus meneghinianus]